MSQPGGSKVVAALATVYFVWGSTYLAMRVAIETLPPLWMAGVRFIAAGALFYAYLRLRGTPAPQRKEWVSALITGTLLMGLGNGLVAISEQWVASGLAAVMVSSMPLWMALFAGLRGQWPGGREWAGLALGLVGVVLLNLEADLRGSVLGAVLLVIAPAAWALGSLFSRTMPLPKGPMASAMQMLMGGIMLSIASPLIGEALPPEVSWRSIGATVYLALFGSILAFTAYGWLLRNVRPVLATSYAYVNPMIAVLLGVAVAGEQITGVGVAGMFVILGGVAMVALRPAARPSGSGSPPPGALSPAAPDPRSPR